MFAYERWEERAELLSPLRGFEREAQAIEYRRDPLTGHITMLVRGRSRYIMKYFRSDEERVRELAETTKANCPFCPGAVEEKTPKFPPEVLPEGRLKVGECWAVPALFAHSGFNAIIVLGREHYRPLRELDGRLLADGLRAAVEILRLASRAYTDLRFATIIMNYLPTSGASLVHPHMQALATKRPFNELRELLSRSLDYCLATGRNFWADLVEREAEEGSRLVGRLGRTWWLVPFAPKRRYEVWCLVESASSLLELSPNDIGHVAEGLARVLAFYDELGISAFNMAFFSGPLGEDTKAYFWLQMRVCARFGLREPYLSDFWALPALLSQDEVFEAPENYACGLRRRFGEPLEAKA